MSPAGADDTEWIEIVSYLTEAIYDNLIFIRGMQVENKTGYKEFFKSRIIVFRTCFEDRLQIIFAKDIE